MEGSVVASATNVIGCALGFSCCPAASSA